MSHDATSAAYQSAAQESNTCAARKIELARRLAGTPAKIVFLTVHADPDYAREALATGAAGYVVKSRLATDLIPALHAALEGRRYLSPCEELENLDLNSINPIDALNKLYIWQKELKKE